MMVICMSEGAPAERSGSDFCAQSLALAFVFAGVGYSLPFRLYAETNYMATIMSPEVANLYMLVAWMGLAHFVFAYRGQAMALRRNRALIGPFLCALLAGGIALGGMRAWLQFKMFSFLMWIYFVPHFVKAELHFGEVLDKHTLAKGWAIYWFPTICFAFLTLVLFCPYEWVQNAWVPLSLAGAIVASGFACGVWKQMQDRALSNYILLAFFVLAEGLVWCTYRKYMDPHFQQGIYVFHIAIASFYHYFRSYDFAARAVTRFQGVDRSYMLTVAAVNFVVVGISYLVSNYFSLVPLALIFDAQYFTFWVGLHQFSSDAFNRLKAVYNPVPKLA